MRRLTYNDRDGVRRKSTFASFDVAQAEVEGTFSAIATSVKAQYLDCNPNRSTTCAATATANPK